MSPFTSKPVAFYNPKPLLMYLIQVDTERNIHSVRFAQPSGELAPSGDRGSGRRNTDDAPTQRPVNRRGGQLPHQYETIREEDRQPHVRGRHP